MCCRGSPNPTPPAGYLTEALIAAIAQGDDEAKARLKAFLEKRAPQDRAQARTAEPSDAPWRHRSKSVVPNRRGAPVRPVRLGPRDVVVDRRPDGTIHLARRTRSRPTRRSSPSGWNTGPRPRPSAPSWRSATPPAAGARSAMRRRSSRCAASAPRCCSASSRPSGRSSILSGNDIEHALLGLAAMYVGIPYAPISPAYSLISQRLRQARASIVDLLTPGLVFAADGEPFRARDRGGRCRPTSRSSSTRNPLAEPADHAVRRPCSAPRRDRGGRRGARRGRARHHRQVPVHLGLDRHAEGGDQHPAHVVLEPGDDPARSSPSSQDEPPVIVDWAPWHHTAGGNHDFGFVLYNGGTLVHRRGQAGAGR